jgi:hypothetical protein
MADDAGHGKGQGLRHTRRDRSAEHGDEPPKSGLRIRIDGEVRLPWRTVGAILLVGAAAFGLQFVPPSAGPPPSAGSGPGALRAGFRMT